MSIFCFIFAVVISFLVGALLLLAMNFNPIIAYIIVFNSSVGNLGAITETLVKTIPIALCALGVTLAQKSNLLNLGAEGQILMGAAATTYVGVFVSGLPPTLHFFLALLFCFLGGAFWGFIPGILKAKCNVSEIFVSFFLNYIAYYIVTYLVHGPWKDPTAYLPHSKPISSAIILPILIPGTRLHAGIILVLVVMILVYILLEKTILGYRLKVLGYSEGTAKYIGINIQRYLTLALVLSGGIAGLAGFTEVAGIHHRLRDDISPAGYYGLGYGYLGVAAAFLGELNPLGAFFASFLYGAIIVGFTSLQIQLSVPIWTSYIIIGVSVMIILTYEIISSKFRIALG
jgi:simple sugar transport system permease protein